jgi:glycosyltransferase involved in cell wall biosynthesis
MGGGFRRRNYSVEGTPILSIITPVFNGERFIAECIESVVAQNCIGVEHIVVDGGSTDRSIEIVRERAHVHSHLRWISEPDRGQSDALNKGIAMARADYIGILNADDFYEPGALRRVIEIIEDLPNPRFITGNCNVLTTGDKLSHINRPTMPKFEHIMVDDELWPWPVNPAAYFYPKSVHEIIGPYNVDEHQGMDLEFLLAAVQAIEPLYIDVVLGNWRYIPGTKTFNSSSDGSLWVLKRKIRRAAWKRAPLKTKLRTILLWLRHRSYHRLKVAYWAFCRHRAARHQRVVAHCAAPQKHRRDNPSRF